MLFSITTQQNTDHFLRVNQRYESFLKAGLQIRYNCAPVGCPAPTHNPVGYRHADETFGPQVETTNS